MGKGGVKCGQCHKQFQNQNRVDRHVREVHDKKKYKCPNCESEFTQPQSVLRHMQKKKDGAGRTKDGKKMTKCSDVTKKCKLCKKKNTGYDIIKCEVTCLRKSKF